MSITFEMTVAGLKLLAGYVAELVRQGVTFKIVQNNTVVSVELTGGF